MAKETEGVGVILVIQNGIKINMKGKKTMKKTLRLLTAMVLTVFMVMSVSMTAFAVDDPTYTITMKRAAGDTTNHTYEAYQVFTGKLSGEGSDAVLNDIDWGSGVNGTNLLAALKSDTTYGDRFVGCADAADVAKVLDKEAYDSALAKFFAAAVGKNLSATNAGTAVLNGSTESVDIAGLAAGYYFIKDADGTQTDKENGNYTRFILKVVKNETVTAKADFPRLDKKILEGDDEKSANTASIGDVITFKLKSNIPDRTGFNKYYFIVNDTLCKGLTYLPNTMTVTVAGKDYDKTFTPTAERKNDGTTSLRIVLNDFIKAAGNKGDEIVITYQAVLNEQADITSAGNPNTANLTYSNDPNHKYNGENEPSDDGDVTGKTPDVTTKTFTTGIKLTKVDGDDNTVKLKGAKFKIEGKGGLSAVLINNEIYKVDNTDGTYYMLKDGKFTTVKPTPQTEKTYDSTTIKYSKIVKVTESTATAESPVNNIAYTNEDGIITFVGLGAGEYTITELEAPEGYNKLKASIKIRIDANVDQATQTCAWTVTKDETALVVIHNLYGFTVENNKGITLPGTGGMGTTIFYVVGGLLILCAGALLVTKVRMAHKEK